MQFNGPDKKESRKVVVTKICFYGKTEKWNLVLLKYNLIAQTKRNLEKEITSKI